MSNSDYNFANISGAAFRSELNSMLLAMLSMNSGTTEPTDKFAYMLWMDTTNNLLKQRDSTNTSWITIGKEDVANWGLAALDGIIAFTGEQTFNAGIKFSASGIKGAKTSKAIHATTMNIWDGGDTVEVTGSATTITDLANAPQAGLWRTLLVTAAHTFTNNANIEVFGNANYICSSGDVILAYAKSTTVTVIIPLKKDGAPIASASIPVGTIIDFAADTPPAGYIVCDGAAVSRTVTYDALFAVIGTTWGAGDGSTTFNLPDFRRRVGVGKGGTGSSELGNAVGNTGGEEEHVLTVAEMPAHTHNQKGNTSSAGTGGNQNAFPVADIQTGSKGSDDPHNNMQPSAVVTKCIKY